MEQKVKVVEQALILSNQALSSDVFRMVVHSPQIALGSLPGQFVVIRLSETLDPLLRRPLSIAGADPQKGTLTLIYRVIGRGTHQMATAQSGA